MDELGFKVKRWTNISIRKGYKLVCNHPVLAGMFLFMFFMYRSFPFLFSLLVYNSPVLVSTAFLLGFLLSLGDPNIPEIDENKESVVSHEIDSLRVKAPRDTTVVERDESFLAERSGEVVNFSQDCVGGGLVGTGPLIEDYFTETKPGSRDIEGVENVNERKHDETVFLENQYTRIEEVDDESVGLLRTKSLSIGSLMAEQGDSPPSSPWKQFGERDDDAGDEDSDSGSDRAESSSPDASMADILPMLDELHPLLNEGTPLVTRGSEHGSDHGSDHSSHISQGYMEVPNDSSDEESENNDDEGDETGEAKDDESKPEITTWTEDDQKNLMDLGSLELERNQRLENLIARRKARKPMVEKNLIDLNVDLPFTVTPILTARMNPFDLPHDSNENMGLPPIPGSAPSIMSQRRNPFDLPYDSSEEKPDLTEDSFQEEFSPRPVRERMFRRHESFNVGPSIFGPPKNDRDEFKFKPFFVPEGSSHLSFQRQTSELSDISKVSSVPETESICSLEDQDDKKIIEEDILGDVEMGSDLEDRTELVGHGSESSEDEDFVELGRPTERDMEHDKVLAPSVSLGRSLSTIEEVHHSSGSSSSSSSEDHERASDEKKHEVSSRLELDMDKIIEHGNENKEPVYDLSPASIKKTLSYSSITSDLLVDQTSEMNKTVVSLSDRQIDFCTQNTEMDAHGELNSTGSNDSRSEVTLKGEQNSDQGLSEYDEKLDHLEEHDQINTNEEDKASSCSLSLEDHHVKTLVQNDLAEEHSICGDAEILRSNEDQIQFSGFTAYSKSLSVENPMDELHFLDKPVVGLFAVDHEDIPEQPTVQLESIVEVHNEGNILSEDHILDPVDVQNLYFQSQKTSIEIHEPDVVEEGDEIQEMDEGLLMELDNVGDFSIGELGSSSNEMPLVEARSIADIESILLRTEPIPMKNEAEINSGMLVFQAEEVAADAPSVEKTEADCSHIGEEIENETLFEPSRYDEIDSAIHELEATSIEDINTDFRQINDGEVENSAIVDSLDARSVSEQIETGVAEISEETDGITLSEPSPYDEIDSAVRELETTSVEDINKAFRQINEGKFEKPVVVESLDAKSLPEKLEAEMPEIEAPLLQIVEARSIEDIDLAFKQHHDAERYSNTVSDNFRPNTVEVEYNAEEIIPGMIGLDSASVKNSDKAFSEIDEFENSAVLEPTEAEDIDSGMNQFEAQSLEDLNSTFKQIKEEFENPVTIETLEAGAVPEKGEAVVSEIEKPKLPVVESRSDGDTISASVEAYDIEKNSSPIPEGDKSGIMLADNQEEETSSNLLEFDAKSVEDIVTAVFEPVHAEAMDSEMEFEVRSPEDLKSASTQIEEEAIESYVIVAPPETDLVPEKSETGVSELERLELSVVKASSIEDIGLPYQQVLDVGKYNSSLPESDQPNTDKAEEISSEIRELDDTQFIKHSDAASSSIDEVENPTLFEPIPAGSIYLETKDLEARSLQHIDLIFRPIKEEQVEEPVVVAALMADLALKQSDTGVSEIETLEMAVVDASSIDDIGLALKHVHRSEEKSSPISEHKPIIVEAEDHQISSKMLQLDAQSIKDIDAAFGLIKEVEKPAVFEPHPAETADLEMKGFEAQSLENVNSTFRHITEEVGMPVSVMPPVADFAPDKSEAGVLEIETPESPVAEVRPSEVIGLRQIHKSEKSSNSISVNDSPVIVKTEDETQQTSWSIEDINSIFNQIKNISGFQPDHDEEITSGMEELEEQTFEDIESALGHFKEEESVKPVLLESLNSELVSEEVEAGISETGSTQNKPSHEEIPKVELLVLEEESLEYVCNVPSTATEDSSSLHVESENKPNSINDTPDIELRSRGDSHPARSVNETENLEKRLKSEIEDVSVLAKTKDILLLEKGVASINEPEKSQTSGDFLKDVESSVENSSLLETSTGAKESEFPTSAALEFDDLSSSLSNKKDKKIKSRKSKSGSSSSSSSSDSD